VIGTARWKRCEPAPALKHSERLIALASRQREQLIDVRGVRVTFNCYLFAVVGPQQSVLSWLVLQDVADLQDADKV
jgi:hypothetical protein